MDMGECVRMHAYLACSPYPPYLYAYVGNPMSLLLYGEGVGGTPLPVWTWVSWLDVEISAYACIPLASPTPLYAASLCIKPHPRTTLFGPPSPLFAWASMHGPPYPFRGLHRFEPLMPYSP